MSEQEIQNKIKVFQNELAKEGIATYVILEETIKEIENGE